MPSNQGGDDFVYIIGNDGKKLPVLTRPADAAIYDVTITGSNLPISGGDTLDVDYSVENTGGLSGNQDIRLDIDGERKDRDSDVALAAGNSTTGTLSYTTPADASQFIVVVWSDNTQDSMDVSVDATFSVTIDSTNSPVDEGNDLDVTATIENTGSDTGNQDIELDIGGTVEDTYSSLSLDDGDSKQITLTWATDDSDDGKHTATISSQDDSDNTTVKVASTTAEGTVVYGGNDETAYAHDEPDWSKTATLGDPSNSIDAIDSDGTYWAVASGDNNVYIYDSNLSKTQTLSQAGSWVYSVAFGQGYVAYGTSNAKVYVHDTSDWSHETTLNLADDVVWDIAWDSSNWLAYVTNGASGDGQVRVHDTSDWSNETTFTQAGTNTNHYSCAMTDSWIAYGTDDGNTYVHSVGGSWSHDTTLSKTPSNQEDRAVAFGDPTYTDDWIAYSGRQAKIYVHSVGGSWSHKTTLDAGSPTNHRCDSVAFGLEYMGYALTNDVAYIFEIDGFSQEASLTESSEGVEAIAFNDG